MQIGKLFSNIFYKFSEAVAGMSVLRNFSHWLPDIMYAKEQAMTVIFKRTKEKTFTVKIYPFCYPFSYPFCCCEWLWMVLGSCGWLWVVAYFSIT